MALQQDVRDMLEATSRTFFIPISRLPSPLQEAVASAYLCMRAIDEIEDHPHLDAPSKIGYLRAISHLLQAQTSVATFASDDFRAALNGRRNLLPAVSIRIGEWACLAPESIAPRIWDTVAATAERMAEWVGDGWTMQTVADLDRYTYAVAGSVGLLLCDLWAWFDGAQLDRACAIHFGRGLQAVNILRNRAEDRARGVDFFPPEWTQDDMRNYARRHLSEAEAYANTLSPGPMAAFISIPLALAHATLAVMARGEAKLSRDAILELMRGIIAD